MSDSSKSPGSGASLEAPKFTERELQLLGWAMQSLKSGPPEIDYEKLANFAGMTNPRSAGNAWANIRKKLIAPDGSVPPTPKKAGGRKKKGDVGEDGEPTPKKTPRKRVNKDSEDGDASPKKKARATKAKPKEEESTVKAEPESADEPLSEEDAAGAEAEEEI
ncbi:hypothetical protein OPT61_g5331 [Boeremia exigua]|uniref:Uncharacterized protein n=1 Tax=Boeremia exigua TaxID=749465 RepID=A0ACC2IAU8_9PLEO|nr:hypothetical protein OPT61_g5331 [Boeremia exigua]